MKDRELEDLENLQQDPNFWNEMNAPPSDDEEVVVIKDLTSQFTFLSILVKISMTFRIRFRGHQECEVISRE
jgi:hypothetical protein